ncbi:MAG: ABC transporter permease subunit, partial [Chloroflexota bacterium]|nr:ABC transporter permease subunit [Chloroflexota bacterium]
MKPVQPTSTRIPLNIIKVPIGLAIPCLLVSIACMIPLGYLILKAFSAGGDSWTWLFRLNTLMIFWRSIILAFSVTATCIAIAVPIAVLLTKFDLKYKRVWEVVTLLPLVIPSYVGAYLLMSAMGPKGLLQQTLHPILGIERMPSLYGFIGALITLSLLNFPYILLTMRGTINQLDPAQEESSRLLGLNRLQTLIKITLPQLRPAIISGGLLVSLYTLSDFGAVSLMRYKTFTWSIYNQYGASFDMNAAALLSVSLCVMATLVVYFESFIRGNKKYFNTSMGASRTPRVMSLGLW